jgi:uncharacterized membrane protein (UPF0127 family)
MMIALDVIFQQNTTILTISTIVRSWMVYPAQKMENLIFLVRLVLETNHSGSITKNTYL